MQSFFKNIAAALPVPQAPTADLNGKVAVVVGGARGAVSLLPSHFGHEPPSSLAPDRATTGRPRGTAKLFPICSG